MAARAKKLTEASIESDRSAFIGHAEQYWSEIEAGSSKAANEEERANAKIVARWKNDGLEVQLLQPFLQHPSPRVRFASAAYLVGSDASSQAVSVLQDLSKNDSSLVAVSAAAVLRIKNYV